MKHTIFSILLFLITTSANAWVISSDFEQGAVGEKAIGPSGFEGARSLTVFSNEQSLSGNQSAKATITEGNDGWKQWGAQYTYPAVKQDGEIWLRVWLYYPNDWIFEDNGPKGLRIHLSDSAGGNRGYFDYFINTTIKLASEVGTQLRPNPDPCIYGNNTNWGQFRCNMEKLGTPNATGVSVSKGSWHAFEQHIKFHSEPGKAMYRAWFDGQLIFEDPLTATLRSSTDYSSLIYLFTTWNDGAPATQSNYVDDVMVTNEIPSNKDAQGNPYIGTGAVTFKSNPKAAVWGEHTQTPSSN